MTVSALVTRNDITATASQTSFTYTFRVLEATDMDVYQNGALLASGYTVNDVGVNTGGTVVLDVGVPVGQIVSLVLAMPLDRTTDYQNSGDFLAGDVNGDFDKIYIGAIQNENFIDRGLRLQDVEPTIAMTLPLKDDRKNKFLFFNATTGVPEASTGVGATNADLVSYTPAGTGAVVTNVQAKLREYVSVQDFGAVGDGVTDDYNAILAALNAMPNGGKLYFPPGTYIVGTAIPLRHGISYYGDNPQATIIKAASGSWDNVLGLAYGGTGVQYDITIQGLTFDGNKDNTTENENNWMGTPSARLTAGETITSSSGGSGTLAMSDVALTKIIPYPSSITGTFNIGDTVTGATSGNTMVIVSKSSDDAFQICIRGSGLVDSIIRNCIFKNSVFTALSMYSNTVNVLVEKNYFTGNNKAGMLLPSPYQIHLEYFSNNVTISNNTISNSLGTGIQVRGGGEHKNVQILNNTVGNTANYGIVVLNATSGTMDSILISGNRLYAAPNDTPESIFVDGSSGTRLASVVISDNTVELGKVPIAVVTIDGATISGNVFNECNSGATVDLIRVLSSSTNVFVNGNSKTTNTIGKLSERSAFIAKAALQTDVTGDATVYTAQFTNVLQDHGSDFDGTSTFTAPITGLYEFSIIVACASSVPSAATLSTLKLITSNRTYVLVLEDGGNTQISNNLVFSGSMIVDMDAGDTAYASLAIHGGTKIVDVTDDSYFSGRLMTHFA